MPFYEFPRPAVTADVVLFAGAPEDLRVLLIRRGREPYAGSWALPGGFLDEDEPICDAARRELAEETGIEWTGPLVEVGAFGDPGRDPRGWTVSVAWVAHVGLEPLPVKAGDDAESAEWHRIADSPPLAFDHDEVVARALKAIGDAVS
ncbi:MAG: NUDIX hydrolase [Coriobacteriia bacterium]|nr:NUDIX hydrolase [Coriobacteriia bacterium]